MNGDWYHAVSKRSIAPGTSNATLRMICRFQRSLRASPNSGVSNR